LAGLPDDGEQQTWSPGLPPLAGPIILVWGIILLVLSIPSIVASLHVGGGSQ